uniref:Uncharacterized protein n=1 Tax=Ciona savignyi TaxID=51511 RepID=H2YNZ1_CIOSA
MDNGPEMASNNRMYKVKSPCLQCSYFTTCLWISVFLVALLMYRKWQPNCKDHENFGKIVNQHDYAVIHHSDVEGNDLMHVQSSSIETVKQVCDTFDECTGFNSNGWLKSSVSNYQPGQADLYIKQLDYKNTKIAKSDYAVDHAEMSASLKIYIYETKIGIDHHPHRVSGYAVERIFADRLEKSNLPYSRPRDRDDVLHTDPMLLLHPRLPNRARGNRGSKENHGGNFIRNTEKIPILGEVEWGRSLLHLLP